MSIVDDTPTSWRHSIISRVDSQILANLTDFVAEERKLHQVFPPQNQVWHALELTPLETVRVVIVGQDPYHDEGQAHGLAFSVPEGVKNPPSLRNIYKELASDLGITAPEQSSLESWAKQGVLLINTVLTVRAHTPKSHSNKGWEQVTDAILQEVNSQARPVVFILWGNDARAKIQCIDTTRHRVIASAHPSPLSASRGFLGSRPFSKCNELLEELGRKPINWI